MSGKLTTNQAGAIVNGILAELGEVANHVAANHVFDDYRQRKSENTIRRQDAGLVLFAEYLLQLEAGNMNSEATDELKTEVKRRGEALAHDPQAWNGITWGLVAGFQKWQLARGYAVSSVNVRLSTIKTYAKLAFKAGTLGDIEYALIRAVEGYSRKEGKRINGARESADLPTRMGHKKREAVSITPEQAEALENQPDTPQGRRDALIMHLLLDLGLRVGEVAGLTVDDFDLKAGRLTFFRPKVDKVQTHELINGSLQAARAYIEQDAPEAGLLLRSSRKDGRLHGAGMSARNISIRVRELGKRVDINGLSAHDCRHYWATRAAHMGTPLDRLQEAGGWSSPAMPLRYIEAAKIANQGVNLR